MGKIWSIINSLQVIAFLALFKVKTPGNMNSFNLFFKEFADFEVIDTASEVTENLMYLPEQDSLSLNLQN